MRDTGLTLAQRAVGSLIGSAYANDDLEAWPGQERLAAEIGLTDRAVRGALAELVASGFLVKVTRGGGASGKKSRFTLALAGVRLANRNGGSGNVPKNRNGDSGIARENRNGGDSKTGTAAHAYSEPKNRTEEGARQAWHGGRLVELRPDLDELDARRVRQWERWLADRGLGSLGDLDLLRDGPDGRVASVPFGAPPDADEETPERVGRAWFQRRRDVLGPQLRAIAAGAA